MARTGRASATRPGHPAGGVGGRLVVWSVATGAECARLRAHEAEVYGLAFSPDGTVLATAGGTGDGTIKLWDVNGLVARAKDGE